MSTRENSFNLIHDEYFPVREDLLGALERYLNNGIMPGGFLTAVLENNLAEAFGRADDTNSRNLKNIVGYVYNHVPGSAWGSRAKIDQWLTQFHQVA